MVPPLAHHYLAHLLVIWATVCEMKRQDENWATTYPHIVTHMIPACQSTQELESLKIKTYKIQAKVLIACRNNPDTEKLVKCFRPAPADGQGVANLKLQCLAMAKTLISSPENTA